MEPSRFARRCRPGIVPGRLALRRAPIAFRRAPIAFRRARLAFRRARLASRLILGLTAVLMTAIMAGWPALLAASGPAGAGAPVVLTAVQGPQSRVTDPGAPTGLTATADNGQVTLSWEPPAEDGGSDLIGYDVYDGMSSGGESATPVNTALIPGTSYTVTGLTNGTTYYFTTDAVNDADLHSETSAEASATPAAAPGAPAGLTATAGDAQVTLEWQAPASDGGEQITGYDIFEGSTANFKASSPVASSAGTSVTVTGLTNGTTYYFAVSANNAEGAGPASVAVSASPAAAVTAPGPPGGLTATAGHGQVFLSWTAPASTGGAAITGYIIYQGTGPDGESAGPVTNAPVNGTSYTVSGLANATTYYFKVAAVNAAKHQGKDSAEASAKTLSVSASTSASAAASRPPAAGGAGIPGAPGGLSATAGNAEVRLSWNAPASDGGSPIVSYRVFRGTTAGFAVTTPLITIPVAGATSTGMTSTGMSITLAGLTNGVTYYFVVTSVAEDGKTSGSSHEASAEPSAHAVLTSGRVPKPVIISLAALAVIATAAALALAARLHRRQPKVPPGPPADVRAVPDPGLPPVVNVHEYGTEETYTVRLEPLPAAISTTIEEVRS